MEIQAKGKSIRSIGAYIRTLDPALIERIEKGMSPEVLRVTYEARPDDWYPYEFFKAPYDAIVAAFDDPAEARLAVQKVGRFSCEETANSFLRLVLRMMTPSLFARKCAQLLSGDFRGFPGGEPKVVYDLSNEKKGEITIELTNAQNHPYLGASAIGYIEFAFEHMGKKNLTIVERDCEVRDYNAPFARWYINWKV